MMIIFNIHEGMRVNLESIQIISLDTLNKQRI